MTKQILVDNCVDCPYKTEMPRPDSDTVDIVCRLTMRLIPPEGIDVECPLEDAV